MKFILKERQYRIPLKSNNKRIRYLERLAAQQNNEIIDDSLSISERVKVYNSLLTTLKLIHDTVIDSKIEDLELRIMALENPGKPLPKRVEDEELEYDEL